MDKMADHVIPIKPMRCPRCGRKVIFSNDSEDIYCVDCGKMYYDQWLGIWRIDASETSK